MSDQGAQEPVVRGSGGRRAAAVLGLAAALLAGGCGGDSKPGPGVGAGLERAGLKRCAGPVRAEDGASLAVYAEPGLAAVVASGPRATAVAINHVVLRTGNTGTGEEAGDIERTERSWRRTALRALDRTGAAPGPCRAGLERLPALGRTEVPCHDELVLPLGRPRSKDRFAQVMGALQEATVVPRGGYESGSDVHVTQPFCRDP